MAKIKSNSVLEIDLTQGSKTYEGKKKTALNLSDYTGYTFKTDGKTLIISDEQTTVTVNNSSKIKYIKTLNETNYTDMIDAGMIAYTGTFTPKKGKISGSIYSDTMDFSDDKYTTKLSINAKSGNDNITGTSHNDTITGGKGKNTIFLNNKNFGDDIVKLTKGEDLTINVNGAVVQSYSKGKSKNDLLVTTDKGTVTLKNYYGKNTGATVTIDGHDLTKETLMEQVNAENYFDKNMKKLISKYTGSALADDISAENIVRRQDKKGHYIEKGVTINTGKGDDKIVGSAFNDVIKGGDGDDTIRGFYGNDKLYGEGGKNKFIFETQNGVDTIYQGKGEDTLFFKGFYGKELSYERDKKDLIIKYSNDDKVIIKNYFITDKKGNLIRVNESNSVKYIETELGKFSVEEGRKYAQQYPNKNIVIGSEDIQGTNDDDIIIANGEDTQRIYTKNGDDVVYVNGEKRTNIYLGTGNKTFYISADTLAASNQVFLYPDAGIVDASFEYHKVNDDLIMKYKNEGYTDYSLTIKDFYSETKNFEYLYYYSGEVHNIWTDIQFNPVIIEGEGDIFGTKNIDIINGSDKRDTIYSNFSDKITPGKSNDTIIWKKQGYATGGDIYLHIHNGDGDDTLVYLEKGDQNQFYLYFDENTELDYEKSGDNLLIKRTYSEEDNQHTETLTIKDYYTSEKVPQKIFLFSGHDENEKTKYIRIEKDEETGFQIKVSDSNKAVVYGSETSDKITGGNGADTIRAKGGDDIITSGKGDDIINAGEGINTINFGDSDGNNTILSGGGEDSIVFTNQNDFSDIDAEFAEDDLKVILNNGTTVLMDDFNTGEHSAKYIKAGETVHDISKLKGITSGNIIFSSNGQTTINGTTGDDIIFVGESGEETQTVSTNGGNNTVFVNNGESDKYIELGEGDDTVYTSSSNIKNVITVVKDAQINGGHDVLYWNGTEQISLKMTNINYEDVIFLNPKDTKDLILKYGEDNTITVKDYYKTGNENLGEYVTVTYNNEIEHTLKESLTERNGAYIFIEGTGEIKGSTSKDYIIGSAEADTVEGDLGNDLIFGSAGDDTYIFKLGDGEDTLYSGTGEDTLKFSNVNQSDLVFEKGSGENADDLIIHHNPTPDETSQSIVRIKDYYKTDLEGNPITSYKWLETKTGKVLLSKAIKEFLTPTVLTDAISVNSGKGDDYIYNSLTNNHTINGGEGNDEINTNGDNITIYGGKGNDTIKCSSESEAGDPPIYNYTIVLNNGDGNDTIYADYSIVTLKFADTFKSDLHLEKCVNDLIIKYNSDGDSLTIRDYFDETEAEYRATYTIEDVEDKRISLNDFISGYGEIPESELTEITGTITDDIIRIPDKNELTVNGEKGDDYIYNSLSNNHTINGGEGNDKIHANGDNITIQGGKGNDIISCTGETEEGEVANYTYNIILNNGSGHDTLYTEYSNVNLKFSDISKSNDVFPERLGNDLILRYNSKNDSVTITDYFIENEEEQSKTTYTITDILEEPQLLTEFLSDYGEIPVSQITEITGTVTDDIIRLPDKNGLTVNGLKGDDYIYNWNTDNNTIYGGAGNDEISITGDSNTIYGGAGNDVIRCFNEPEEGETENYTNTIVFYNDDGNDSISGEHGNITLKIANDLTSNIHVEKLGDDLILKYNGDKDTITIEDYFNSDGDEYRAVYTIEDTNEVKTLLSTFLSEFENIPLSNKTELVGTETDNIIRIPQNVINNTTYDVVFNKNYYIKDYTGVDVLNIQNDESIDSLSVIFNVNKNYKTTDGIEFGDITLLESTNIEKWGTDEYFREITVLNNSVETINFNGKTLSSTSVSELAQSVAGWLTVAKEGVGYEDVNTALNSGDDVSELIALFNNPNWQNQ